MIKVFRNYELLTIIAFVVGTLSIGGCGEHPSRNVDPSTQVDSVKILVEEEGIFKVSVTALESAGMALRGKDLQQLHLSLRGVPQSIFISRNETFEGIVFYGRASRSVYTSQNVYILEFGDTVSDNAVYLDNEIGNRDVNEHSAVEVYTSALHLERNELYFPQVVDHDHWFWQSVAGGQSINIPFVLEDIAPGPGLIRMGLWSNTETSEDPDHHLIAAINHRMVLDSAWNGKGGQILEAIIPENVLLEGENQLVVDIPGDTQASVEVYWIDWLELEFPQQAIAQSDALQFKAGEQGLLFRGFIGRVQIFDITRGDIVDLVYSEAGTGEEVYFAGQAGCQYYAVGETGYLIPSEIAPLTLVPDLTSSTYEIDYVAIGPEDFLIPINELLEYRAGQGLKVMSIPLSAIYDQFNYGFPEPEAIKNFLEFTSQSWIISPRYVLLVGDASYDPRNYLMQTVTPQLPTYLVQTVFGGQTASDFPYADVNGDQIPDLALARVPASTISDVQAFVKKTIEYEAAIGQSNEQFKVVAIADGQEVSFSKDAQLFLDALGNSANSQIYSPAAGMIGGNEAIVSYFEGDYTIVAYFGHGSVQMWGRDQLLTIQNAEYLTNSEYPLVINMTCLTGLFTHPTLESVTEVLLFNPSGGAVAVIAPTSLTLPSDQRFFSEPLARVISAGQITTLGDIFLAVQQQVVGGTDGIRDVLTTFILFGDPALILNRR